MPTTTASTTGAILPSSPGPRLASAAGSRPPPAGPDPLDEPLDDEQAAEERLNAASHAAGALLGLVGLGALLAVARAGGPRPLLAAAVFGGTLVALYLASAIYHGLSPDHRWRPLARTLDHAAIYLLIAGTYTPYALLPLRGRLGAGLLIAVWTAAALGVLSEGLWAERPRWLGAAVYLAMGWMALLALPSLLSAVPGPGLWLLVGGGLCYSIGTVFYVLHEVPYMHAVWHLCVLAGSACHFLSVLRYVLPAAGAATLWP